MNNNINIAWDATSLDVEHVNEVHINYSGSNCGAHVTLVVQIDILAGDTTHDYVDHI